MFLSKLVLTHIPFNISTKVKTSHIKGVLFNFTFHLTSKLAAIKGRAAFLEPLMITSPDNSFHQFIIYIYLVIIKNIFYII